MAYVTLFVFFLLTHLLLLYSAEGVERTYPDCSPFNCGKFGIISFPFTNISHRLCGVLPVNCDETPPTIRLPLELRSGKSNELPVKVHTEKEEVNLTAEYDLEVYVSDACSSCYSMGGLCELDNKRKFHCAITEKVKVLNNSKGNEEEFINEVTSISRTSHVNIVTLKDFCFEGSKIALIYELMPNGSLEKVIYKGHPSKSNQQLGWETLYNIAIGIARGLEYLHRHEICFLT
uniref:Protein kinase domain-containing protein n=1 Tax=Quercus lobata TaxID=97700 RepID=A0A7N2KLT4_QUELO